MKVRVPFRLVRTNAGVKLLTWFINMRCKPPQNQWAGRYLYFKDWKTGELVPAERILRARNRAA